MACTVLLLQTFKTILSEIKAIHILAASIFPQVSHHISKPVFELILTSNYGYAICKMPECVCRVLQLSSRFLDFIKISSEQFSIIHTYVRTYKQRCCTETPILLVPTCALEATDIQPTVLRICLVNRNMIRDNINQSHKSSLFKLFVHQSGTFNPMCPCALVLVCETAAACGTMSPRQLQRVER